jgi:hypothetical protein
MMMQEVLVGGLLILSYPQIFSKLVEHSYDADHHDAARSYKKES